MEEILYEFNPWCEEKYNALGILRNKYLNKLNKKLKNKKITFIIGLRRVGKTTLIKQLIAELCQKINPKHILFISLEHPIFINISILDVVKEFRKIHGLSRKVKIYLFFDEIHYKQDFDRELKILHDNENVKIFASGSSASLIKNKKAFLTGRHSDIIIKPLTFIEFLKFKEIEVKKSEEYLYKKHFLKYIEIGGMPEYVLTENSEVIINLVNDIIYKDIIGKHKIKNSRGIKELFLLLCERCGKRLTYNKIAKILSISVDTAKDYISFFEEAFLVHLVYKHEKSLNARIKAPRKIYVADTGIRNVFTGFRDLGAVFENLVFLEIKNKNPQYYFENGKEIDFVFGNTAIEAKFKQFDEDELKTLKQSKFKNKIVVKDYKFFLD